MAALNFYIDLHCHPNYKPFAKAHHEKGKPPGAQSSSPSHKSSVWHYDPPSLSDKVFNYALSVTKFRQNNLTAAYYGRLFVMVAAMGCVEKFFFKNKAGTGVLTDLLDDFAAGFGKQRINTIENLTDYWLDFGREMSFMMEMQGRPVRIDGQWFTYRMPRNFRELQNNLAENAGESTGKKKETPIVISIIPATEGLHILNCGLEQACDAIAVKANALALKQLHHSPWFVTFSHHFYNELCGHARSLRGPIGKITNQEEGINSGFTALGLEVLDILLDKSQGKRILIDVKHLSPLARREFFSLRKTKYQSEVPVIISHGVANGLPAMGATISKYPELGNDFINPVEDVIGGDGQFKDHNVINFYDEEIVEMVLSDGIMGLQLDERRVANEATLRKVKHSTQRNKIMHYRSEVLWKQIQYIAELLDHHDLYAWGHLAIGSDYDGMVDPLNSFWTAEEFDDLAGYLERHAYNYFKEHPDRMRNAFNRVSADLVIQNIFRDNAWNFLKRWF